MFQLSLDYLALLISGASANTGVRSRLVVNRQLSYTYNGGVHGLHIKIAREPHRRRATHRERGETPSRYSAPETANDSRLKSN